MAVRLMVDSTEAKNGHCEAIMDFVVSWTLRRAQNECRNEPGKGNLYKYCRRFLGLLINQDIHVEDEVRVETWKQENDIDLWVRATINGINHDILIEDKYYTKLHDNQLEKYKSYFDKLLDDNHIETVRHYVILTCRDKWDIKDYEGFGFEVFAWDDMIDAMSEDSGKMEPSGSDIFDEFWINWQL